MTRHRPLAPTHKKEIKSFPIFVTKVDEALGIVEAVVSVFGVLDYGRDIIWPGAFTKTIVERAGTIRVVDQHNTDSIFRVLGRPLAMREVGRDALPPEMLTKFPTATGGLWTQTQYDLDTPEGLGAFNRIKSKSINEYSIGYEAIDADRGTMEVDGKKVNVRNIRQIRLWEFSPVIWGMNPATGTTDVKEMTADGPVARFGDYLHGELLRMAHCCLDDRYAYGFLSKEEYDQLSGLVDTQLEAMRNAIPEELADRPLWWSGGMIYDASNPDPAIKAGRMLSRTNAEKIKQAYESLTAVMSAAGLLETPADEADEPDASEEEAPKQDEPPAGSAQVLPTDQAIKLRSLQLRAQLLDTTPVTLGEQTT